MDFKSVTVNNCYILRNEVFDSSFFSNIEAKAVYSASVFHLAFFKKDITNISQDILEQYEKLSIDLYRLNSSYLNIPFEINFHENKLYQSYYESDNFPLSLWFEEKNLIPFNIFLKILEDILYALRDLDKSGHSHLFLTPEEILIPLQWDKKQHAKLNNIGINCLVSTILTEKEILEYRSIYHKKGEKAVETGLINKISDDLYSFGTIMSKLLLICDTSIGDNKGLIQEKLDQFINKPSTFLTIEEAISLFQEFFTKDDESHMLPEEPVAIHYSGRATFDIPEYDEWQEEAVLEPYLEETDSLDIQKPPLKKERFAFYKRISTFISGFFKKSTKPKNKAHEKSSLKIINESKLQSGTNKTKNHSKNTGVTGRSKAVTGEMGYINEKPNNKNINNVLQQIQNHYEVSDSGKEEKTSIENKQESEKNSILQDKLVSNSELSEATSYLADYNRSNTQKTKEVFGNSKDNNEIGKGIINLDTDSIIKNVSEVFADLSTALTARDYRQSYSIIQNSIDGNIEFLENPDLTKLNDILDKKLKELDDHYITNDSSDIIAKLEKIKTTQLYLKKTELEKREVSDTDNIEINESETAKNLNLFLRILYYLKKQYLKLTNKK